ncbi:hypothetical protein [Amycolatopsis benzoatilytica]|uniref:hypothetical protein n=1 Tax=Amycolatopsis benzoatilytica TaxID=346045 RepID=UPI000377DAE7|nr:hypothetical protein [Amycolatopsis benzoatilytica]
MAAGRRVPLALLDSLAAGLALGYLARQYRDVLLAHGAMVSLAVVVAAGLALAGYRGFRTLERASARVDAIVADELSRRNRRPSPRPRP